VVAWSPLLSQCVVYAKGASVANCSHVLGLIDLRRILRVDYCRNHQWSDFGTWIASMVTSVDLLLQLFANSLIRRWMFIIEGAITVVIAFGCYFILPNFPRTTKWLSEQERQLAVWRLEEDVGEDDWVSSDKQNFWDGLKLAVQDMKTYVLMFLLLGLVSAGSVTNFFPSVVGTLGYNTINTLLLTVPPYVLAVITAMLNAWHADRTGERYFHITLPMYVALVAFILAAATTATAPRYVAMMLMVPGVYTGYVVALAWVSNSIPRPPAKRAAALAIINAFSNIAQIYSSFMYIGKPRYSE
jgi:hypothetical protein